VAHGIGNTLYEQMRYDATGLPLTTTFSHYLLATANEVPPIEILLQETPSPLNPLGVKGAGEGSLIPVAPAVVSAIEDALAEYGVQVREVPLSPMRLVELIWEAQARQAAQSAPADTQLAPAF
jgi:carbon-monoxide dehydrogenase large subunit